MRFKYLIYLLLVLVIGCDDTPVDSRNIQQDESPQFIRVPSQAPTIQEAIDRIRKKGTVLVADGLYKGDGNRDIDFGGKSIKLLSENGPLNTTIDCGGSEIDPHCAFIGLEGVDNSINGFTVTGAYDTQGSVLNLKFSSPVISNCIIVDNFAALSGGAIRCKNSSPTFVNCTFANNSSPLGGAVYLLGGSNAEFINCIIAFSSGGSAIESFSSSNPILTCCDLFGNSGGDWTGKIATQFGQNGNISQDPLFCSEGNYRLSSNSPCISSNNSCNIVIGATTSNCN